jgi:hypothetical protein
MNSRLENAMSAFADGCFAIQSAVEAPRSLRGFSQFQRRL